MILKIWKIFTSTGVIQKLIITNSNFDKELMLNVKLIIQYDKNLRTDNKYFVLFIIWNVIKINFVNKILNAVGF